jgi:DNA-binding XRE family transcriptional regulator
MPRGRPVNKLRRREMFRLRTSGLSLTQIGRQLGVSRQYVHQQLRKAGAAVPGITCPACAKEIAPRRGGGSRGPVFCLACLPSDATFGQRLLTYRVAAKLTQAELAAHVGMQRGTVNPWEKDRRRPTARTMAKLICVLGPGLKEVTKMPRLPEEALGCDADAEQL